MFLTSSHSLRVKLIDCIVYPIGVHFTPSLLHLISAIHWLLPVTYYVQRSLCLITCWNNRHLFCVCVCLPWWLPVACRLLSIICVLLDSARAKRISTKGWVYLSAERLMFDVSQRFHGEPSRAPAALQALLTWKYQTQTVHPTLCLPIPETRRRCFLTAGCPAVMMWGRKALRYNKGDGCFSEVKTVLEWNTPLGFRPSAQQAAGLPGVAPLPVLIGSTSKQYVLTRVFSWAQQTFQTLCYSLSVWVRY